MTGEYLARMEDLLHLYSLPYDERRPVVCFDELPVQLLGEVVAPLPMQAGKPTRFDYEYEREGTACLLVAFEPLTGRRLVETSKHRTKADYCRFMQRVAALFPRAEKVVLVQDNLNTHNASSFYENLPAEEAFVLAHRFEMHYTPKKGSWLNMAELELSALSRICLSRRIASIKELDREVQALVKERNELKIKVEWQFSITQAREKLSRHYEKAKSKN
jgi:DDE superfamily endonuclease